MSEVSGLIIVDEPVVQKVERQRFRDPRIETALTMLRDGIDAIESGHVDKALTLLMSGIDEYAAAMGKMPAEY